MFTYGLVQYITFMEVDGLNVNFSNTVKLLLLYGIKRLFYLRVYGIHKPRSLYVVNIPHPTRGNPVVTENSVSRGLYLYKKLKALFLDSRVLFVVK